MRIIARLLIVAALLISSPLRAQLSPVLGDQRQTDRDAIRNHLDKIFQGFIRQDAAALRAGHSTEWRGFLESSRQIGRGIEDYMQSVGWALKSPVHMTSYRILDLDVVFYGDVAVVPYICEVEGGGAGQTFKEKLRILDVFAKLNGDWIQVATDTGQHPDSLEAQLSELAPLSDEDKKSLLDARETVWRAYFANDRARLEELLPPETIAIDPGVEKWENRDDILAGAKNFAASGGKLVRLEFPQTQIQVYGGTAILYSKFLFETEVGGKRAENTGRATETFVYRKGKWVNSGWHIDSEK